MWKNLMKAWAQGLCNRQTARVTIEIRESGGSEIIDRILVAPGSIATIYLASFDSQRKWTIR